MELTATQGGIMGILYIMFDVSIFEFGLVVSSLIRFLQPRKVFAQLILHH